MLDINYIVDNFDEVFKNILLRYDGSEQLLYKVRELHQLRKNIIKNHEDLAHFLNVQSNKLSTIKNTVEFNSLKVVLRKLGDDKKNLIIDRIKTENELKDILLRIPNLLHEDVPVGNSEEDNKIVYYWGTKPKFDFSPKEHTSLGINLGMLDFERATKIVGTRFSILLKDLAHLNRALISFMLDLHTVDSGYTEIYPPAIVTESALEGTGNLPKFEKDLFKIKSNDKNWYLIPTAEVPITNFHANEILLIDELPKKYCAFTSCFRAEAGSSGKDTHGLIRQHQFDKVELVMIDHPNNSLNSLELITNEAEKVLQKLGLHYRKILHCSGDMTFSSTKSYDLEVWLPGQNTYREISSCSSFGDFQARRANIKFKSSKNKKSEFVHTLNASGLAIGRTIVAILEQYQQENGDIVIPTILQPYMLNKQIIKTII